MKINFIIYLLLYVTTALAQTMPPALVILPAEYKDQTGTKLEITNMPRVRSQGPLGVCYAFVAATLAQKYYCDERKSIISDCSNLPSEREISPIHMSAYLKEISDKLSIMDMMNYHHILIDEEHLEKGGNTGRVIINSQKSFSFFSEACMSYDQFVSNYGQSKEMANAVISGLERTYNKYKTNSESVEACEECVRETLQEVNKVFSTKREAAAVKNGLKRDTFGEFLYTSVFSGCKQIVKSTSPKSFGYPKLDEVKSVTNEDMIKKVKEILNQGVPFGLSGFCTTRNPDGTCKGRHGVVVSGYKRACNASNECRDVFKVQNSWGAEWQKLYNDGWVDAKSIFVNMQDKDNKFSSGAITWITQ